MTRTLVAVALTLLVAVPMRAAAAQQRDFRFEITAVGDTTVTFRAGRLTWVVRSPSTIVVDPKRRDALVARLRVVSLSSNGEATAVVTGQTGRITTDHFVIAVEPRSRWYRSPLLWIGTAFGLAAGFALGKL
jgi:hypothetical protein